MTAALTLEAIDRDPMAVIRLPLPDDASPALLEAASYAAFIALQHPDDEAANAAGDRLAELDEPGGEFIPDLDQLSPRQREAFFAAMDEKFPKLAVWRQDLFDQAIDIEIAMAEPPEPLTHEAIDRDRLNAVNLPLPADADRSLLARVDVVAASIERDKAVERNGIRDGSIPPPQWAGYPNALAAHEEAEAASWNATFRRDEVHARQAAIAADPMASFVSDEDRAQHAAEASTRPQDPEPIDR
jgi:hypothetical protein